MSAVLAESQSTALAEVAPPRGDAAIMPGFNSNANWELAQRVAKAFASSSLVPEIYRGNIANCLIALEMANRMGASPLLVMQNLYVVHGNPSWSAKFLIATFNQNGRFSAMRYEWNADRSTCRAYAIEKGTGERLDGPTVSVEMAKAEGWSTKNGSKWKTMPELMLMYRAATFFVRTYAPELSMGLQTSDEVEDVYGAEPASVGLGAVRAALTAAPNEDGEVEAPAAPAAPDRSFYTATAIAIEQAGDAEIAGLVLDEARSTLSGTDYDDLCALWKRKWDRK